MPPQHVSVSAGVPAHIWWYCTRMLQMCQLFNFANVLTAILVILYIPLATVWVRTAALNCHGKSRYGCDMRRFSVTIWTAAGWLRHGSPHTRVCNLSLVNLTQDMPTHTWNPLNAFFFSLFCSQEVVVMAAAGAGGSWGGVFYSDLHSWLSQCCQVFITVFEHHAGAECGNYHFFITLYGIWVCDSQERPLEFYMSTLHRFVD